MILVRYSFQCKFGTAGEVVKRMKDQTKAMAETAADLPFKVKGRIMTDLSGPFDTIVQELEFESLMDWEKMREAMFASEEFEDFASRSDPPYTGGTTELYTIELDFEN